MVKIMGISNRFCSFIIGFLALFISYHAVADKVAQWDLRDYDNNNTTSAFSFVVTPDGSTGDNGGARFGDQIVQIDPVTSLPYDPPLSKETRCNAPLEELMMVAPGGVFDKSFYDSDFGQPCNVITFDKGAPTDIFDFTFRDTSGDWCAGHTGLPITKSKSLP